MLIPSCASYTKGTFHAKMSSIKGRNGRDLTTEAKDIKKQRYYFANKGLSGQGYGFPSGHVWM